MHPNEDNCSKIHDIYLCLSPLLPLFKVDSESGRCQGELQKYIKLIRSETFQFPAVMVSCQSDHIRTVWSYTVKRVLQCKRDYQTFLQLLYHFSRVFPLWKPDAMTLLSLFMASCCRLHWLLNQLLSYPPPEDQANLCLNFCLISICSSFSDQII